MGSSRVEKVKASSIPPAVLYTPEIQKSREFRRKAPIDRQRERAVLRGYAGQWSFAFS